MTQAAEMGASVVLFLFAFNISDMKHFQILQLAIALDVDLSIASSNTFDHLHCDLIACKDALTNQRSGVE